MSDKSDRYSEFEALSDLRHDRDLAGAIGDVIIAWSYAEGSLLEAGHAATGMPISTVSDMLAAVPTFESKVKVISTLVRRHVVEHSQRDSLLKAIEELQKLSGTRNGWVHGRWAASIDKTSTVIFDVRKEVGSPERRRPIKQADVDGHYDAVIERAAEIMRLAGEISETAHLSTAISSA
jgi:hypothetical protein